jgi:hypothetical protein
MGSSYEKYIDGSVCVPFLVCRDARVVQRATLIGDAVFVTRKRSAFFCLGHVDVCSHQCVVAAGLYGIIVEVSHVHHTHAG